MKDKPIEEKLNQLRVKYNENLARIRNAEKFFDSDKCTEKRFYKFYPEFETLVSQQSVIIMIFEDFRKPMTKEQIREGFKGV